MTAYTERIRYGRVGDHTSTIMLRLPVLLALQLQVPRARELRTTSASQDTVSGPLLPLLGTARLRRRFSNPTHGQQSGLRMRVAVSSLRGGDSHTLSTSVTTQDIANTFRWASDGAVGLAYRGNIPHPPNVTTPPSPSTVMCCPLRIRWVATPVPSTAGTPYSRATIEL